MLPFSNRKTVSRSGSTPDFAHRACRIARDWWHAGQRPLEVFVLAERNGSGEHHGERAVHLFTSAALAIEYGRVRQFDADAYSIEASKLAEQAAVWVRRGVETFVLDRCARCKATNFVAIEVLRSQEQFGQFWAFTLITQEARMRHFAVSAFRSLLDRRLDDIVPELKKLRDHVNAGCPAVHYALGSLHMTERPDRQEELLAASKEHLVELARADLADEIPDATEGLTRGFEVLRQMAEGRFDLTGSGWSRVELGIGFSQNR